MISFSSYYYFRMEIRIVKKWMVYDRWLKVTGSLNFEKIFWELCDKIFCRQFHHLNSNYDKLSDQEMQIRSGNPVKNFNASGLRQNCWDNETLALDCSFQYVFGMLFIATHEVESQLSLLNFSQPMLSESLHEIHFESMSFPQLAP
jgi:hypothetical protein